MGRFSKLERPGTPPDETGPPFATTPAGAAANDDTATGGGGRPRTAPRTLPPLDDPIDYPSAMRRADDHFFRGEFEKALRFYSRALQSENTQTQPWVGQVVCLLQMKQVREADLWIARALEVFPEDAALLSLRAVVMARNGMVKRAVGTSDYAMTKSGTSPVPWIARGEVLAVKGSENAKFCFDKALEQVPPEDWKTPFLIGLIHYDLRVWASALEYFQKAAARGASNYWLWYLLGVCFHRLSFRQEALDALRQSIAMNPAYPPAQDALRRATRSSFLSRLLRFGRK